MAFRTKSKSGKPGAFEREEREALDDQQRAPSSKFVSRETKGTEETPAIPQSATGGRDDIPDSVKIPSKSSTSSKKRRGKKPVAQPKSGTTLASLKANAGARGSADRASLFGKSAIDEGPGEELPVEMWPPQPELKDAGKNPFYGLPRELATSVMRGRSMLPSHLAEYGSPDEFNKAIDQQDGVLANVLHGAGEMGSGLGGQLARMTPGLNLVPGAEGLASSLGRSVGREAPVDPMTYAGGALGKLGTAGKAANLGGVVDDVTRLTPTQLNPTRQLLMGGKSGEISQLMDEGTRPFTATGVSPQMQGQAGGLDLEGDLLSKLKRTLQLDEELGAKGIRSGERAPYYKQGADTSVDNVSSVDNLDDTSVDNMADFPTSSGQEFPRVEADMPSQYGQLPNTEAAYYNQGTQLHPTAIRYTGPNSRASDAAVQQQSNYPGLADFNPSSYDTPGGGFSVPADDIRRMSNQQYNSLTQLPPRQGDSIPAEIGDGPLAMPGESVGLPPAESASRLPQSMPGLQAGLTQNGRPPPQNLPPVQQMQPQAQFNTSADFNLGGDDLARLLGLTGAAGATGAAAYGTAEAFLGGEDPNLSGQRQAPPKFKQPRRVPGR